MQLLLVRRHHYHWEERVVLSDLHDGTWPLVDLIKGRVLSSNCQVPDDLRNAARLTIEPEPTRYHNCSRLEVVSSVQAFS